MVQITPVTADAFPRETRLAAQTKVGQADRVTRPGDIVATRSIGTEEWALLTALAFAGVVLPPPLGAASLLAAALVCRRVGLRGWVSAALVAGAVFVVGLFLWGGSITS